MGTANCMFVTDAHALYSRSYDQRPISNVDCFIAGFAALIVLHGVGKVCR